MGGIAKSINVEKTIALGDDLISVLSIERESDDISQCLEGSETLRSSWEAEFQEIQTSIEGCHQRIEACKHQINEAKNQTVAAEELDRLQQDLEEELTNEKHLLDELSDVIEGLESKRISIEKLSEDKKKREKDDVRMQNMLCMCTQVTRIIPDLENKGGISGYIVDGEKRRFEKFQFEAAPPSFEICNKLWKMLES